MASSGTSESLQMKPAPIRPRVLVRCNGLRSPSAVVTFVPRPNRAVLPFHVGATRAPGGVKEAAIGAAKRTLDAEDRFERIEKGGDNRGRTGGAIRFGRR